MGADSSTSPGAYKTLVFQGEPKGDPESAKESAADVALRYLVGAYGIVIDDWNYSALVEYRERAAVAQQELRRKTEALKKEVVREKQQLDGLIQGVKDLCLEFADLLPVRAAGGSRGGVEYVGPPSPASGFDELALGLVQLLQEAADDE